jgi:hypothetical protein
VFYADHQGAAPSYSPMFQTAAWPLIRVDDALLLCHPEWNEVKSRDPVEVALKLTPRDPSTALGMTDM